MVNNNIIKYNPEFSDLNISKKQIIKYLGYPDNSVPEPYPELIDQLLNIAKEICKPKAGFVYFNNIVVNTESQNILINKKNFVIGNKIKNALKSINSAILFVCTAGPEIENYSKKLYKENNTIEGYIMDVIGSEIVESAMDYCQARFEASMNEKNLSITNRYSPGYCGWNVSEQHKLFSLLPDNFCNIKLKDSALMIPIKSISGIIGIGKNIKKRNYSCDICDQKNCVYRKVKGDK
ncbi:vitamin B12 dependent-methionine synthase activation domain-containing protein [Bacteroidota bacterium]